MTLQYLNHVTAAARPAERGRELLNGGAAYYRVYRCADGAFVALGAIEPKFWAMFCEAVGRPEWTARQGDPFPQTDLTAAVAALLAEHPRAHWLKVFEGVDCCFEPVLTPMEALTHPHAVARGMVTLTEQGGEALFACHADGTPPPPRKPHVEAAAEAVRDAWLMR